MSGWGTKAETRTPAAPDPGCSAQFGNSDDDGDLLERERLMDSSHREKVEYHCTENYEIWQSEEVGMMSSEGTY
jgi:hypothetical protein